MDLAGRFRALRVRAEMTKTALARPRYTVSYVSQIESGKRRPSPEALAFFAERLGVAPEFLATGVPEGMEEVLRYRLEGARRSLRLGDAREAEEATRSARSEAEEYGLAVVRAQACVLLGEALMAQTRFRAAIDAYEEALEGGHLSERDAGMAVSGVGRAYRNVGDLTYAAEVVESFLSRGGGLPLDPGVVAELHAVLISIYFERGDIHRAERAAERALAAADLGAPPEIRANVLWDASRVMAEAKRWQEALDFATRARMLMEELEDLRNVARLHTNYAFLCLESDPPRLGEAHEHLDAAESWLQNASATRHLAFVHSERARLALLEGRYREAVAFAERAIVGAGDDDIDVAKTLFVKGRALTGLGRVDDARRAFLLAGDLFEKHGARQQLASCWREVGELDLSDGQLERAVESFRTGLEALGTSRARP
ncbi:MAG: helix-turn-helix domain-containing protein [Actinomycetota bacterium]|nr:helix-turn-helix domain-containing protein [Actinomycetota bacterium]